MPTPQGSSTTRATRPRSAASAIACRAFGSCSRSTTARASRSSPARRSTRPCSRPRHLPARPLMHGAAQWAAFGALHQGGTVVLQGRPERLDPDDVWGTVERERVNLLVLVGDAFARPLLDGLDRRSYDLSGLFVIVSGGAIL